MANVADYDLDEPLLRETGRISAIPLDPDYELLWGNLQQQRASYWTAEKIRFTEDVETFPNVAADLQTSMKTALGYFAGSDEIVEQIITRQFIPRIRNPELLACYDFEAMMETIHSEVYNRTILAYVNDDEAERMRVLRAVETMPSVQAKAEWARQWISDKRPIDYSFVGKACVEGINFSSSFAFIDWLKSQRFRFPGLYLANAEISRDENRHVMTSVIAHTQHVRHKLNMADAKTIMDGAVEVELDFVDALIPDYGYKGMTRELMRAHVRHATALLANDLGYPNLYPNTACPFDFVDQRGLDTKANFFERDSSNYTKLDIGTANDEDIEEAFAEDAEI